MRYTYYKEVTEDFKADYVVPMHTYVLNENKQCVGFIQDGKDDVYWFSKPMIQFDKKRRKFKNVTKEYAKRGN